MDHDGNVGGDEFLATLIDWGQVCLGLGAAGGGWVSGSAEAKGGAGAGVL